MHSLYELLSFTCAFILIETITYWIIRNIPEKPEIVRIVYEDVSVVHMVYSKFFFILMLMFTSQSMLQNKYVFLSTVLLLNAIVSTSIYFISLKNEHYDYYHLYKRYITELGLICVLCYHSLYLACLILMYMSFVKYCTSYVNLLQFTIYLIAYLFTTLSFEDL